MPKKEGVKEKKKEKKPVVKKPAVKAKIVKKETAGEAAAVLVPEKKEEEAVLQAEKKPEEKKKAPEKKPAEKKQAPAKTLEIAPKPDRYWEAVGRRKTSVARIRLFTKGDKGIFVNEKTLDSYFQTPDTRMIVEEALKKMKSIERFRVSAKVSGGGLHSQAEAIRHGISRALTKFNPDFRKRLRRAGFLTRDPRAKERKKFGLKKARKAPQWAKR